MIKLRNFYDSFSLFLLFWNEIEFETQSAKICQIFLKKTLRFNIMNEIEMK